MDNINNEKITMTKFDCELIIDLVRDEYYRNCSWEENPETRQYWYVAHSKKAKQLGTLYRHLTKQLINIKEKYKNQE